MPKPKYFEFDNATAELIKRMVTIENSRPLSKHSKKISETDVVDKAIKQYYSNNFCRRSNDNDLMYEFNDEGMSKEFMQAMNTLEEIRSSLIGINYRYIQCCKSKGE